MRKSTLITYFRLTTSVVFTLGKKIIVLKPFFHQIISFNSQFDSQRICYSHLDTQYAVKA